MKNATVELNGKTYDAVTGAMVEDVKRPEPLHKSNAPATQARTHAATAPSTPKQKPVDQELTHKKTETVTRKRPHNIASHAQRSRQPSQTLMRRAVKKPAHGLKKSLNVQTPLVKQADRILVKKVSVNTVSPSRLQRAKHIEKHEQVKHYAHSYSHPAVSNSASASPYGT